MLPYLLAIAGGYLIGKSRQDQQFDAGGRIEKFREIRNSDKFNKLSEDMQNYVRGQLGEMPIKYTYDIQNVEMYRMENGKKVEFDGYSADVLINGEVVTTIPAGQYDTKEEIEDRCKRIIEELKNGTYKGYSINRDILDDRYLRKYFAKGGMPNTPMSIAKKLYTDYNQEKREEFLVAAGYSKGVAKDLSKEEWSSLEKGVHSNLSKVLQSGRRKGYGQMAKGGRVHDVEDFKKYMYNYHQDFLDKISSSDFEEFCDEHYQNMLSNAANFNILKEWAIDKV